jgi:hypothetical protein
LILKNCELENLYEINFQINVLFNLPPDFTSELQTAWKVNPNQKLTYILPNASDYENHAIYIYLEETQGKKYPKFMTYNDATRTIMFAPKNNYEFGRTFYFSLIIKERLSINKFVYNCSVIVTGTRTEEDGIEWADVTYSIESFDKNGRGVLVFSVPINAQFMLQKYASLFDVYWTDFNYTLSQEKHAVQDFAITGSSDS